MKKDLLKEIGAKSTKITSTAPHSLQKNAIVEQIIATLFAVTPTALAASVLPKKFWSTACMEAINKAMFLPVIRSDGKDKSPNLRFKG